MTRRRWIADHVEGNRAFIRGQNAEHLSRVLRARVGQEFEVAAGGRIFPARITEVSDRQVGFELLQPVDADTSRVQAEAHLYLAIFKFDRMEWAIEKATELGVSRIIPVAARRSDAHLVSASAKRVERWRRIVHEAAQQSRRATPPEVSAPVKFKQLIQSGEGTRIVLSETERHMHLADVIRASKPGQPLALAVGPEGGWTADELAEFTSMGWSAASLGPHILRAETAAIAALAIVNGVLGIHDQDP